MSTHGCRYSGVCPKCLRDEIARLQRELTEKDRLYRLMYGIAEKRDKELVAAEAQLAEVRKILEARGEYVVRLEAQRNAANQELMHAIERTTAEQEGLVKQLAEMRAALAALVEANPCERFVVGCNLVHTDVDEGEPFWKPLPDDERCLSCQVAALASTPAYPAQCETCNATRGGGCPDHGPVANPADKIARAKEAREMGRKLREEPI